MLHQRSAVLKYKRGSVVFLRRCQQLGEAAALKWGLEFTYSRIILVDWLHFLSFTQSEHPLPVFENGHMSLSFDRHHQRPAAPSLDAMMNEEV